MHEQYLDVIGLPAPIMAGLQSASLLPTRVRSSDTIDHVLGAIGLTVSLLLVPDDALIAMLLTGAYPSQLLRVPAPCHFMSSVGHVLHSALL